MSEKISVIIPLYNKSPYIVRALNSVLKQTFQNFEVIVVDDGSTDNGAEIVRGFVDPRIRLIRQENRGVSAARNRGADEAISDFVAFLDADDEWMPSHLETIVRLMDKYPAAGMYNTACKIQTSSGKTQWIKYAFIPNPPWEGLLPNYFLSEAVAANPIETSTVVIPRKIFQEMRGFNEEYWYGEDADLFGRIALKYPVAFSWELGAIYHWEDTNRATKKRRSPDYEEPFVITARDALKKGEVRSEFIQPLNEFIARKEIDQAMHNVRAGNSHAAQMILKRCSTKWHYNEKMEWWFLSKLPYPIFQCLRKINLKIHSIWKNVKQESIL
jgi:glycosyltransferase involved in cell wall biosynthesis